MSPKAKETACVECGNVFTPKQATGSIQKTCSAKCRKTRGNRIARDYYRAGKASEENVFNCEICGKEIRTFAKKQFTCSVECRRDRATKVYKKRKAEGYYKTGPWAIRYDILQRDGFRCGYCGAEPEDARLHVDHVRPKSRGGAHDPSNYITTCAPCNLGKGARILSDEQEKDILRKIKMRSS